MSDKTSFLEASQKLKNVASQISGLPIKYVIAVDFVGFQRLIGYGLDGIDVEVSQTFEDPWYPIAGEQLNPCGHSPEEIAQLTAEYSGFELEKQFACRYEQLYFPQGMVKMEGGDALKYVRSRHSSSDFDRSRRQAEVLLGIRRKLFSLNALQDVPKYFQALSQYVSTDLNLEIVEYLAPLFLDADQFSSKSIVLSTENVLSSQKNAAGAFVLVPQMGHNQWQAIKDFIQKEIQ
ncbi:Transcriptional regulator LytR [bioreactor metagenome]|uniref:Transcriptional regulator LytR n=1 Tax=bioreactor metagenome TaxID=1076179 RepID=A0A645G936_9ZZZZ